MIRFRSAIHSVRFASCDHTVNRSYSSANFATKLSKLLYVLRQTYEPVQRSAYIIECIVSAPRRGNTECLGDGARIIPTLVDAVPFEEVSNIVELVVGKRTGYVR